MTIMGFCTMEGYAVGFIKVVAVVEDKRKLSVDEGAGTVISGGSFEGASDENL